MYNLLSIMGNPKPYSGFYVQDVSGQANTVSIKKSGSSAPTLTIETSTDGKNWSVLGQTSTSNLNIQIPANGKVYLRCSCTGMGRYGNYNKFYTATGDFKIGGNIMSFFYGKDFTGNETSFPINTTNACYAMFVDNNKLVDTSELILPATTLVNYCYNDMFARCTSLISTPVLLPNVIPSAYCYAGMFQGCTSLITAPELPLTTTADGCYVKMFYGCTSLTTAPVLPAKILIGVCYKEMFRDCTSLSNVTCLAEDISATNCTQNWLNGVSATGTFTKSPNMSSWTTGANGIPSGWTVQDAQ